MRKLTFKEATRFEGSSLQGYIDCDYATLKKVFGKEHSDGDGYKVDAEWALKFSDGTYATIYNYKDGKNYCGKSGLAKTKITDWHVGGQSARAVACVEAAIEEYNAKQNSKGLTDLQNKQLMEAVDLLHKADVLLQKAMKDGEECYAIHSAIECAADDILDYLQTNNEDVDCEA